MRHGQLNRWSAKRRLRVRLSGAAVHGVPTEAMDLLAGQSVGLVHEIKPAATLVRDLADGARKLIEQRLAAILVGRQA